MLNLNTKTLWMCKLQNSKPFSVCQCKPPKEQRIKYPLSSLTMIGHVPVLKSAAGSHSNTPKQSRAFSNKHEKKRDILIQISAPALLLSLKVITLLFQTTSLSRTWGRKKIKPTFPIKNAPYYLNSWENWTENSVSTFAVHIDVCLCHPPFPMLLH